MRHLDRVGTLLVGLAALAGLILLGAHNLANPNLWWDEAGQYWMSQGQNHVTGYLTSPGPLLAGVEAGWNGSNLDPSGFTVLLRGWIELFGTEAATLRSLPFLFFVLAFTLTTTWAARRLHLPPAVALAVPLLTLSTSLALHYSTEVRAFSLEMLWVIVTAVVARQVAMQPTIAGATGLALVMVTATATSRYSYVVAAGAAWLTVVVVSFMTSAGKRRWTPLLIASLGLAASAVLAGVNAGLLRDAPHATPSYVKPFLLSSGNFPDSLLTALSTNLGRDVHLLTGLFLVLGGLASIAIALGAFPGLFPASADQGVPANGGLRERGASLASRTWFVLLVFIVAYELGAMAVSAAGFAPWNAATRWSIGLIGIATLAGLGLAALALELLRGSEGRRPSTATGRRRWITVAGVVLATVFVTVASIVGVGRLAAFRAFSVTEIVSGLNLGAGELPHDADTRWIAHTRLYPSVRYWAEASGLASETPANLERFSTYESSGDVLMGDLAPAIACLDDLSTVVLLPIPRGAPGYPIDDLLAPERARGCNATWIALSPQESALVIRPSSSPPTPEVDLSAG